jgi:hypothetical protein
MTPGPDEISWPPVETCKLSICADCTDELDSQDATDNEAPVVAVCQQESQARVLRRSTQATATLLCQVHEQAKMQSMAAAWRTQTPRLRVRCLQTDRRACAVQA